MFVKPKFSRIKHAGGGGGLEEGGTHTAIEIMAKFMDYDNDEEIKVMADIDPFGKTPLNRIKMGSVDLDQVGVNFPVDFSVYSWVA